MISRMSVLPEELQLFLLSFLLLFLELALIRWLGSNILFLSYFSNFILLGSFFGIGIGFLFKSHPVLFQWSPLFFMGLIIFVTFFPVDITYNGSGIDSLLIIGLYKKSGFPIWVTLPFVFIAVAAVMASIANRMANLFKQFKPLHAYRLDILGSLAGIIAFSLLAYFNASPVLWGTIVCLIFVLLFFKDWQTTHSTLKYLQMGSLFVVLFALAYESGLPNVLWSPYYKIAMYPYLDKEKGNFTDIWVNGVPHQRIEKLERRKETEPFYFYPYQYIKNIEKVLIIGAGTGSDVAIALAHGAKHIDAIEIDPVLYKLGIMLNPDQPYKDPRVHVKIMDGRAFLEQSHDLYDMILFALTDSITLVSGQSSLRLESYLYTKESLQAVKEHLKPNGIFSMYNYYNNIKQPWLAERYANTVISVFNKKPCLDKFGQNNAFSLSLTVSPSSELICKHNWSSIANAYINPITDDHPFLYLKENKIPTLYLYAIFFILMITILILALVPGVFSEINNNLDLFLMGMAFLLLETKSVISFALLFGNTWIVNALVFFSILTLIYFAIEVVHRFPKLSSNFLYAALLISVAINWILPNHLLLQLPFLSRFVIASLITFSPIFLANLLFANRFQHTINSTAAFGINMLGAMLGGMFEYTSLITGNQFLLILIAIFYSLAYFFKRFHVRAQLKI